MYDSSSGGAQSTICALIVDDVCASRKELEGLLAWMNGVGLVASVGSGTNALKYFAQLRPDLVLINLQKSGMTSVQLAQALSLRSPNTTLIVASRHSREMDLQPEAWYDYMLISRVLLSRDLPLQILHLLRDIKITAATRKQ